MTHHTLLIHNGPVLPLQNGIQVYHPGYIYVQGNQIIEVGEGEPPPRYDANGLVDDFGGGAHVWAEMGARQVGYGDFNPTWQVEGAGVWLATDYHGAANTFDPDPPGSPTQDIDDKLILQKGGGMDEGAYNLPSAPPNPWANHAVWFDRDASTCGKH